MRKTKLVFLRLSWCIPDVSGMIFSCKSLLIFSLLVHNRKNLLKFLINFITDWRRSVEYSVRFFIFFFEFKIYSFMLMPTFLKKTIRTHWPGRFLPVHSILYSFLYQSTWDDQRDKHHRCTCLTTIPPKLWATKTMGFGSSVTPLPQLGSSYRFSAM